MFKKNLYPFQFSWHKIKIQNTKPSCCKFLSIKIKHFLTCKSKNRPKWNTVEVSRPHLTLSLFEGTKTGSKVNKREEGQFIHCSPQKKPIRSNKNMCYCWK